MSLLPHMFMHSLYCHFTLQNVRKYGDDVSTEDTIFVSVSITIGKLFKY